MLYLRLSIVTRILTITGKQLLDVRHKNASPGNQWRLCQVHKGDITYILFYRQFPEVLTEYANSSYSVPTINVIHELCSSKHKNKRPAVPNLKCS